MSGSGEVEDHLFNSEKGPCKNPKEEEEVKGVMKIRTISVPLDLMCVHIMALVCCAVFDHIPSTCSCPPGRLIKVYNLIVRTN